MLTISVIYLHDRLEYGDNVEGTCMAIHPSTDASLLDLPAESEFRDINGVTLHVVTAGSTDDPLVVLLHGFPEFWYSWHRHIGSLVNAGYRVLVPDQRGYNLSTKPEGIRPYRLTALSQDVVELIKSEGNQSARVVGHDWGAAVAWDIALRHPKTVDQLGILNVPHPSVFQQTLRSNLRQLRKSWYAFFFQLPRLPEWFGTRNNYQTWIDALQSSKPDTFTEKDFKRYRIAWSQEGAPTAMIHWYRAIRYREELPRERVTSPTMVIWGENDHALIPEMASKSIDYCDDGRLKQLSNATHWLHHEHPERISKLLLDQFET